MNVKGVRFERRGWAGAALGLALTAAAAGQGTQPWALSVEGGAAWNARTEIRIPNDAEGTRFDLGDLDDGPYAVFRAEASWRFGPRQGLRLLVAPLEIREEGAFDEDVRFQGETYRAGAPLDATFRFNSYRLTYRYLVHENDRWTVWLGGTAKIRDAKVELEQDGVSSRDTDVGLVPLLHTDITRRLGDGWSARFAGDFMAASQGRAIDVALLLQKDLARGWSVAGGYRVLEGGADNDDVYTFSWLNYAVLQVTWNSGG